MKLTMTKDKLFSIVVSLIIMFLVFMFSLLFNYNLDLKSGLNVLTVIAICIYIWILWTSYKLSEKVNIYFFLILLTIPFYLGDQLSLLIGFEELMLKSDHSIIDGIIANKDIYDAMFFLIFSLLSVHVGYILMYKKKSNIINKFKRNYSLKLSSMRLVGVVLFIISFIPAFYSRFNDIYLTTILGHLGFRLDASSNSILYYTDYISDWFIPACFIIIISTKKILERKIAIVSLILYVFLYLLSGSRMEIVGVSFASICIYIYWFKNSLNKKQIMKMILGIIALIIVFEIVGATRNSTGGLSMFSFDELLDVVKGGLVYNVFETTGNTFTSIANTFRCVPVYVDFNDGKSILGSILYIFPSFLREPWLSTIITHISSVLSPYYYGWTISGYGSSFITEAYFNFGYFSLFLLTIYGLISARIIMIIENVDAISPFKFYFAVYMILEMSNAIRNDLYFVPRHLMLYVLLPYLLMYLFSNKSIAKGEINNDKR